MKKNRFSPFGLVILFFYFQIWFIQPVICQQAINLSDTISLGEVRVTDFKLKPSGFKQITIESQILQAHGGDNIGQLISENSTLQIKSYGITGLSSTSVRGTEASHTKILWNGISLNSPMLGQSNLSDIPAFFVDQIFVFPGSNSYVENCGSLGGTIQMQNSFCMDGKNDYRLLQEFGSFHSIHTSLGIRLSTKQVEYKVKGFRSSLDMKNSGLETQKNASNAKIGLLQELYVKPSNNQIISAQLWTQKSTTSLPSLIKDNEKQDDNFARAKIEWNRFDDRQKISIRSTINHENMNYTNQNAEIDSKNKSDVMTLQTDYSRHFSTNFRSNTEIKYEYSTVRSNNYSDQKTIQTYSFSSGINYAIWKINGYLLIRQDFRTDNVTPTIPSIGFNFKPFERENLNMKVNLSRNYRRPTFNDLYWNPGGNPDLLPEKGFSTDAGIEFSKTAGFLSSVMEITSFYSAISNWIMWTPETANVWTPKNLKEVHARGIELCVKEKWKTENYKIFGSFSYSFTKSTNENMNEENLSQNKKQLIYIPLHSANASLSFEKSKFNILLNSTYTGKRYIYVDNSASLPAYWLTNLMFRQSFRMKKLKIKFNFMIDNLFNKEYISVMGYDMPGRSFKVGLELGY